jgi:FkbM family methyltransferase
MSESINDNVLGLCEVDGFCPWKLFDLNENSFVVDLGSFRGDFSKYIYQTYNCRVDAYEPSDMNLEYFELSHPKLTVIKKAVYDGSVVRFTKNRGAGGSIFYEDGEEIETVDIREITKEHIDLLKVNIEGAEIVVLGLADLNNVDQVLVEFHLFRVIEEDRGLMSEEIKRVFERIMSFGYRVHQINDAPAFMFYDKQV